jgi:hypothetical protein
MMATIMIVVEKDVQLIAVVVSIVSIPCSSGGEDVIVNDGRDNVGMIMEGKHMDGRDKALEDE